MPRRVVSSSFPVMEAPGSIVHVIEQHKKLLTPQELAELLSMSAKTLYARVKAGTIPVIRIGASIRFDPATTARWLREKAA